MYALFALAYFGFATMPLTEVSAQEDRARTIKIISGNNQETTRGQQFPHPVTFKVTDDQGAAVAGKGVSIGPHATYQNAEVSLTPDGSFVDDSLLPFPKTNDNGEVTVYVRVKRDSLYDTCIVGALITVPKPGSNLGFNIISAAFTGRITDVLNFRSTATTLNVPKGAAAGTNIGDPISATHWRQDVTLTYSLEGTDAALFTIDASTGQLKTKAGVNYYTKKTYSVTIKVTEESGGGVRSSHTIDITINPPKRRIMDCPVGWVRSDGFAGRNRRVLLYEVKLAMDLRDRVSIYKPIWVAIYVHPDETLENLDGWKLQIAVPYNHHRDYLLTAENSVVLDAGFVEGGFAFIENPIENPFPMVGVGFTGSPAPGFDYRLYDDTGRKVDFGISCYKRFDVFQVLKDLEDPRVLRNVSLKDIDWNASWFIRSEWTVPAVGLYPKIGRSGL